MRPIAVIFFVLAGLFFGGCALWGAGIGLSALFGEAYEAGAGFLAAAALGLLIAVACFRMAGRS